MMSQGPARAARPRGVTARAILLGLLLTPVNVYFLVKSTWSVGGFIGGESLFPNTVAFLFLLTLLNEWLKRRGSRHAFGPGELLTIYLMLGISTGLFGSVWSLGGSLAGTITYPFWMATPENRWQQLMWPHLPTWLTIQDPKVLEGFYTGSSTAYTRAVFRAWFEPALWWTLLMGTVMWVALCHNSIVRRRWADEEKLPFPITTLPVQLVDERFDLLRSRLFWAAAGASAGIGAWNTLVGFVPTLPGIPLSFDYTSYVSNRHPWEFIRYRGLDWGPWYLGLCYLMPLDLAFSLFLFDLVWTAQYILAGHFALATSPWSGFPYGEQQTAGGFIALILAAFWLDRRYLVQVLRRASGLRSSVREDGEEALSYRAATLGAIAGLAVLWWLLARGGMKAWVALSFLGIYFLMALVISRLRAQLGPPTHPLEGDMPNWVLPTLAGTRALGPGSLGMLLVLRPYLLGQTTNPTPLQLEALKMAEGGRMERPRIALALALVAPLAMICYFWASIHIGYQMGLGTGKTHVWHLAVARWGALGLDTDLRYPSNTNTPGTMAMGFGAAFTLVLMYLKLRFQWWPLHPVAYPIAPTAAIQSMTLVIFATWLFKALLLRYGGLRAHRRALPFFLGLLAGSAGHALLERVLFEALGINR